MFYVNVTTAAGTTGRMVEGDSLTVGRSEDSDLVISHETLSRRHLVISQRGDQIYVEDLGSSNGSFKNGERLPKHEPTPLHVGDELRMGEAEVTLEVALSPAADVPSPVTARAPRMADAASPTRAMSVRDLPPDPLYSSEPPAEPLALDELNPAGFTPHWASAGLGAGAVLVLVVIYHVLAPSSSPTSAPGATPAPEAAAPAAAPAAPTAVPAAPPAPREPVAAVPIVRRMPSATGYQMSYVDNVNLTPNFAHKYLGDEFQRKLTRDLVPAAAKQFKLDQARVVQALGVTAELVKTLEDRRTSVGETPVERVEAMRRLETDARAQLADVLGSPARVPALMQMEKPLYDR